MALLHEPGPTGLREADARTQLRPASAACRSTTSSPTTPLGALAFQNRGVSPPPTSTPTPHARRPPGPRGDRARAAAAGSPGGAGAPRRPRSSVLLFQHPGILVVESPAAATISWADFWPSRPPPAVAQPTAAGPAPTCTSPCKRARRRSINLFAGSQLASPRPRPPPGPLPPDDPHAGERRLRLPPRRQGLHQRTLPAFGRDRGSATDRRGHPARS